MVRGQVTEGLKMGCLSCLPGSFEVPHSSTACYSSCSYFICRLSAPMRNEILSVLSTAMPQCLDQCQAHSRCSTSTWMDSFVVGSIKASRTYMKVTSCQASNVYSGVTTTSTRMENIFSP